MRIQLFRYAVITLILLVIVLQIFLSYLVERTYKESHYAESTCASSFDTPARSHAHILEYIRDSAWEHVPFQFRPTNELIEHASNNGLQAGQTLSWISTARELLEANHIEKAAQSIIGGVSQDRTFLAYLFDDIDSLSLPLIRRLVQAGSIDTARALVSAYSIASGAPVAYLRNLLQELNSSESSLIWDKDPYVYMADFSVITQPKVRVAVDFQRREGINWNIEQGQPSFEDGCLRIEVGKSEQEGDLVVLWQDMFMKLTPGSSGLRLYARSKRPEPIELVLNVTGKFVNGRVIEQSLRISQPEYVENGWLCFDTASETDDLWHYLLSRLGWEHREAVTTFDAEALEQTELRLTGIGLDLPAGKENTFWIGRIELYLPEGSWNEQPKLLSPSDFSWGWGLPLLQKDWERSEDMERQTELEALGYVGAMLPAPSATGILVYDEQRACPGYNFYVSGHGPEIILMDMNGVVKHTWRCNFNSSKWPGKELPSSVMKGLWWRRAHLYPNGDVLAVSSGRVLVKMDKDGEIIWAKAGNFHHDFDVMDDGTIYVLYREWEVHPFAGIGNNTLVDYVLVLDNEGNELRRVSLLKAIENSVYAPLLRTMLHYTGDILHTNSISVLDGTHSETINAFQAGNVLICMLHVSFVGVVNLDDEKVIWGQRDQWLWPHDPHLTTHGTMLIFDNKGPAWHPLLRPASRILEFDPLTREVVWQYTGSREQPFYSAICGAVAQLPNNNILVSETVSGRAFEVTRDKEIVWEFINPHEDANRSGLIAHIFDLIRVSDEYVSQWLQ